MTTDTTGADMTPQERLQRLSAKWRSQGDRWGPSAGVDARRHCADELDAEIAAMAQGEWVLVPRELTMEQRGAAQQAFVRAKDDQLAAIYAAFLAAAPPATGERT